MNIILQAILSHLNVESVIKFKIVLNSSIISSRYIISNEKNFFFYYKNLISNKTHSPIPLMSKSDKVKSSLQRSSADSFFILDYSSSEIDLDLSFLSRPESNQLICSPNSKLSEKTSVSSNNLDISSQDIEVIESDDDIICDGSHIRSFIPFGSKQKLLKKLTNSSYEQKQLYHKKNKTSINISKKKIDRITSSESNEHNKRPVKISSPEIIILDDEEAVETETTPCKKTFSEKMDGYLATNEIDECTNNSSDSESNDERNSYSQKENSAVETLGKNKTEIAGTSAEMTSISGDTQISSAVIESEYIPIANFNVSDIEPSFHIDKQVLDKRYYLDTIRKWELTNEGRNFVHNKVNSEGLSFTFMSYNVLSETLLNDNKYLYKECDKLHLSWDYRWCLFQHEIRQLQPDILSMQEIEVSYFYSHYQPWFSHYGYKCLFKKRTGNKLDGCAIMYKAEKFKLLESTSVEYNQPKGGSIMDRDNIGLIVKLTPLSFHLPFCIANTHILYNPKRHDVKLAQFVVLLTELDRLCYKEEKGGVTIYDPIILSGDFNTDPFNPLLAFLRRGFLQYKGLSKRTLLNYEERGTVFKTQLIPPSLGISERCQHIMLEQSRYLEKVRGSLFSLSDKRKLEQDIIKIQNTNWKKVSCVKQSSVQSDFHEQCTGSSGIIHHLFNFHSVYGHNLKRLYDLPEVTTKHDRWLTVDYIFYSKAGLNRNKSHHLQNQNTGPLHLLGKYGLLSSDEAEMFVPWPSAVCPSDHFPLVAQFLLKPKS